MAQIYIENLVKTFKVAKRQAGMLNALKSVVHKEYTVVHALDGISFSLEEGELVGYIGPNGAGKSTTVKVMSGILVPDSGICKVMGRVPWKQRVEHVSRIGVVFGQRSQLWWDVPVIDSFELLKDMYRVEQRNYDRVKDELIERLALGELLDVPVRQLSLGQRMRCEIAASLLHEPKLIFLDEPTIGLDAVSKLAVRSFIKQLNKEKGVTVILTTHDMDDIEALCSRVMVIGKGKLLFDGSMESLRNSVSPERRLIVDFEEDPGELAVDGAQVKCVDGTRAVIGFLPYKTTASRLITGLSDKYPVKDVTVEDPPIEEIIAKLYGELRI